jgi:hypothetical protein
MKKFIALFALTYIGFAVVVGLSIYLLAPQSHPSSINTIDILLSVTLVGFVFARKHKRVLTSQEYRTLVISCIIIDAAIQSLFCLPLLFSDKPPAHPLLPILLLVIGGHALLFAVGFSSRVIQRYVPAGT